VLEVGRGVKKAHMFYPDGSPKAFPELEEFEVEYGSCYDNYDRISLYLSKNFDSESGFCGEID